MIERILIKFECVKSQLRNSNFVNFVVDNIDQDRHTFHDETAGVQTHGVVALEGCEDHRSCSIVLTT